MREKILVITTYIAAFLFFISLCALDSGDYVPYIVAFISGIYLFLRGYAEGLFEDEVHYYGR